MNPPVRPWIIPFFLPHAGCPHRCIFCDQHAISATEADRLSAEVISDTVTRALNGIKPQRHPVQVAFFGGNFLGQSPDRIAHYLDAVAPFVKAGLVDSIRFSTRPDSVTAERLDWLQQLPIAPIELGVQSMNNGVLRQSGRGHRAEDTLKATALLAERKIETGVQMMVGLPGDTRLICMETARKLALLQPAFVRIYPTVVLKGSPLASLYRLDLYHPLTLEDALALVKELYLFFSSRSIPVIRMGLQASDDLHQGSVVVAGPYHPAFGHLVFCRLFADAAARALIEQPGQQSVKIRVRAAHLSRMRGHRNQNIARLKDRFGLTHLSVEADDAIADGWVEVNGHRQSWKTGTAGMNK